MFLMLFLVCSTDKSNENNEKKTNNEEEKNSLSTNLNSFALLCCKDEHRLTKQTIFFYHTNRKFENIAKREIEREREFVSNVDIQNDVKKNSLK